MEFIIPIAIIIAVIVAIIALAIALKNADFTGTIFEPGNRRAGRKGEETASNIIRQAMHEDDLLFTNVSISYDGKPAELDNVVVNTFGVFIIEVKNYKGQLYGKEDDYTWKKYKNDGYGNIFVKDVKNPIKQVKRQVYILAKYLDYYGSRVWVEGYALLLRRNSPVNSSYILSSIDDIDKAIHTPGRTRLNNSTIETIAKLLS